MISRLSLFRDIADEYLNLKPAVEPGDTISNYARNVMALSKMKHHRGRRGLIHRCGEFPAVA
jgi:hypothetical protein